MGSASTPPEQLQYLISLPERAAADFERLTPYRRPTWFALSDPRDTQLGSGGATVHALIQAWQSSGPTYSFDDWLQRGRRLIIHGGGASRRLPAYAALGKPLMPLPLIRDTPSQRLDQTLLDLQIPHYRRLLQAVPPCSRVMLASGDVLIRFSQDLPPIPDVDVLGVGMRVQADQAQDFGVFFREKLPPHRLQFFLQKPSADRIKQHQGELEFLVDTGIWFLSVRAVQVLLHKSGWRADQTTFPKGYPETYEFYSQFALALGDKPSQSDTEIGQLTHGLICLPNAEFHHFGTSEQLLDSATDLQPGEHGTAHLGSHAATRRQQNELIVLNSQLGSTVPQQQTHSVWIENSHIPSSWELSDRHVLTGIPENHWTIRLAPGVCIDIIPLAPEETCVRVYGFNDQFRGPISDPATRWLGRPLRAWFANRGLLPEFESLSAETDIHEAPLFPVIPHTQLTGEWIAWLTSPAPESMPGCAALWRTSKKLSAREIPGRADLGRLLAQRSALRELCMQDLSLEKDATWLTRLDLEATANTFPNLEIDATPPDADGRALSQLSHIRRCMLRSAILRHKSDRSWMTEEGKAFQALRTALLDESQIDPLDPQCTLQSDQIVWARCPVRLDLAGGWTDTPPYCLEHGGTVVNLAVDLNGQPPQQVFARMTDTPEIVVRSIDLGTEERICDYSQLRDCTDPTSSFALAKAALALSGFLPEYHVHGGHASLADQLQAFGGGIELSTVSAVPKGSGLGTSSIMATTLLATLADLCGLDWDSSVLFRRTLALEQRVTTGGGWQDQAGGIYPGLKLIETHPGLRQEAIVRWLPDRLFSEDYPSQSMLLYYTGLTRLAKGILQEVVRGMFLNSPTHQETLAAIAANAHTAFHALLRADYSALARSVQTSWRLNQQLDPGTNPPAVQQILDRIGNDVLGAKLLGAGGGGYLLILAKDPSAANRIRQTLAKDPPSPRARFVRFSLSRTGLQVTRS